MAGFMDLLRNMVVRISVDSTQAKHGFNIIEDRLQNIRQIMMGIKDVGVFLARTVFTFGKAGANLESMEIKFGTLARSMELGKAKLEELNKFATETPFTLPEVRRNTAMLMAMGVSLKDIIPTMTKLGNVTAGLPNMSLERLALNFGQVMSQGHLTGRELRDFAVGGVPIMESLRDITGKTDQQLRDMMKDKKISFDMVNQAFDYMVSSEGRFHKLLDKMANSSEGLYNNIKVTWDLIKEGVGKELLKDLKPLLREFKDFLSNNRQKIINKLKTTIIALGKALIFLYKTTYKLFKILLPFIELLINGAIYISGLTTGILNFIVTNKTMIKVLKVALFILSSYYLAFGFSKIVAWTKAIQGATSAVGAMGPVLVKGKTGVTWLMAAWATGFKNFMKSVMPFLAIGALIIGTFLILQDMYIYTMGKLEGRKTKTVTATILEGLTKGKEVLKKQLEDIAAMLTAPFAGLIALGELLWLFFLGSDKEFDEALKKHDKRLRKISEGTKNTIENYNKWLETTDLYKWAWRIDEEFKKIPEKIGLFAENIKAKLRVAKAQFANFWQETADSFSAGWVDFKKAWDENWATLSVGFDDLIQKTKMTFVDVFNNIITTLQEVISKIPILRNFIDFNSSLSEPKNSGISGNKTTNNTSNDNRSTQVNNNQTISFNVSSYEEFVKIQESQQSLLDNSISDQKRGP